jgi:hypothetical protein
MRVLAFDTALVSRALAAWLPCVHPTVFVRPARWVAHTLNPDQPRSRGHAVPVAWEENAAYRCHVAIDVGPGQDEAE